MAFTPNGLYMDYTSGTCLTLCLIMVVISIPYIILVSLISHLMWRFLSNKLSEIKAEGESGIFSSVWTQLK